MALSRNLSLEDGEPEKLVFWMYVFLKDGSFHVEWKPEQAKNWVLFAIFQTLVCSDIDEKVWSKWAIQFFPLLILAKVVEAAKILESKPKTTVY